MKTENKLPDHAPDGMLILLRNLESVRFDALIAKDMTTLDNILDEDLIHIHSSGLREDKTTYMKSVETGRLKYLSFEAEDPKALVLGEGVGMFSGTIKVRVEVDGQIREFTNAYSNIWTNRTKRWRMVFWQTTGIAAK